MQNFIVLGIIPGTNVQISFSAWLIACGSLAACSWVIRERHALKGWALSHYVAYRISRLSINV